MAKKLIIDEIELDEEYFGYLVKLLTIASIPLNNSDYDDYHKVILHLQQRKMIAKSYFIFNNVR